MNVGKAGAIIESTTINASDTIANYDLFYGSTIKPCTDFCTSKFNFFKASAIIERIKSNACYTIANYDTSKTEASTVFATSYYSIFCA